MLSVSHLLIFQSDAIWFQSEQPISLTHGNTSQIHFFEFINKQKIIFITYKKIEKKESTYFGQYEKISHSAYIVFANLY